MPTFQISKPFLLRHPTWRPRPRGTRGLLSCQRSVWRPRSRCITRPEHGFAKSQFALINCWYEIEVAMRYTLIGIVCLVVAGLNPTQAQTASQQPPDNRTDATTPRDGVIKPRSDAAADSTVHPPNVDPNITVPPP